jgi:hypothetical protein
VVDELLEKHSQAHDGLDIRSDRISRSTQGVRQGFWIRDVRPSAGTEDVRQGISIDDVRQGVGTGDVCQSPSKEDVHPDVGIEKVALTSTRLIWSSMRFEATVKGFWIPYSERRADPSP